jgi:hypothetical protein
MLELELVDEFNRAKVEFKQLVNAGEVRAERG